MTTGAAAPEKQNSEADEGWIHVKPKARRGGAKARQFKHDQMLAENRKFNLNAASDTEASKSPEQLNEEYRRIRAQYEEERACKALKRLVEENGIPTVSKAVCLGIGTFDPPDGGWDAKRRTYIQLSAFLILVESIENQQNSKIDCAFQEPIFSSSDKTFLEDLGHRVVESPEGFDLIDEETLVFGVHLYRPIYAQALKSLPAIFVGTDLDTWDRVTMDRSDEVFKIENGKMMEDTYTKQRFPQDSSVTAFTSTSIYWRPASKPSTNSSATLSDSSTTEAGVVGELSDKLQSTDIA